MKDWRLGIDVGGTNTDAVVLDESLNLVASVKSPTTEDVMGGIENAMAAVLDDPAVDREKIGYAMLGTTHCTNAIVERKRLCRVAVIRIGAPATRAIRPMIDWPADLRAAIGEQWYLVQGGFEFDGREIAPFQPDEVRTIARSLKGTCDSVAITGVFSPVNAAQEKQAAAIVREELGEDFPVSISSEIGSVSLLERENATILNAALTDVARTTSESFLAALAAEHITDAEIYLCQNDGTLMSAEYAMRYPILTIACGPTNSIRGASFLTGVRDAVIVDVGGTTTDVGVLASGFPRESMLAVEIGGVRTNFRMPDIVSIGLGGGSIVRRHEDGHVTVGPDSVGYRVTRDALVFGGDVLTATDVVVAAGMAPGVGDASKVAGLDPQLVKAACDRIRQMVEECVDRMKTSAGDVEVVLVGGGSILVPDELEGVSTVNRPEHAGVANAIGSAISQVSGQIERIYSLDAMGRTEALADAKRRATDEAVKAGAAPDTVEIIDVEDVPLAYLPGNATRIRVKAVGDLNL
jgi:N-methylhydantoinase A/oxoprolinase/acetone carboxylase beta subunit